MWPTKSDRPVRVLLAAFFALPLSEASIEGGAQGAASQEGFIGNALVHAANDKDGHKVITSPLSAATGLTEQELMAGTSSLEAWHNHQPFDAAIGSWVLESFYSNPADSYNMPGKGDPALDPCPVLNDWPDKMEVDAPNPCAISTSGGNWNINEHSSGSSAARLMSWSQTCSSLGGGLVPVTTYTLPTGGLYGTSQLVASITGNTLRLNDCVGYTRYYVDEKVYHVPGQADAHACEVYGSCDGSVFTQYFIRDHAGKQIARTSYLRLFQSSFTIEDDFGLVVASVERIGAWNPMSKTCDSTNGNGRRWMIKFPDLSSQGASQVFQTPPDRWPVAELVTIMATRDSSRLVTGLVAPSICEMEKTGLMIFVIVFAVGVVAAASILFLKVGMGPMQSWFMDFEGRFCPRRMYRPSRPMKPHPVFGEIPDGMPDFGLGRGEFKLSKLLPDWP